MSRCVGKNHARKWGDAHEENTKAGEEDERDMDLENNGHGRDAWDQIWNDNKERSDRIWKKDGMGGWMECVPIKPNDPRLDGKCKAACEKALADGKLKVLDKKKWN